MGCSLDFTLVTDGSSDLVLKHPISWLLRNLGWKVSAVHGADFSGLPRRPRTLREKIQAAGLLYPSRLLVVHRDAERQARVHRLREIEDALKGLATSSPPAVCLVPVRMTEAWLLFDEMALRTAAGNPNGRARLDLPRVQDVEGLPDPKVRLHDLLESASGRTGRRRRLDFSAAVHRVGELVDDWSPLRRLPAFQAFEQDLVEVLGQLSA